MGTGDQLLQLSGLRAVQGGPLARRSVPGGETLALSGATHPRVGERAQHCDQRPCATSLYDIDTDSDVNLA